ncbi:MAG: cytidylate kinase family protein [Nitrososphaerales archaeon]
MAHSIIISGLPAVGKTTIARVIADKFNLKHYSGGDVLKEMAIGKGYSLSGNDWWDTEQGIKFLGERKTNPNFDKQVDEKLVQASNRGGVVITSYTLPWLAGDAVKFWLKASKENRAKRMAKRDNISYDEALKIVSMRDEENKKLYFDLYGIKFGEDLSVFDYVINTDQLDIDGVIDITCTIVKHLI